MSESEKHHAIKQAHCVVAVDAYFDARPVIDTIGNRRIFEGGFDRGFDLATSLGGEAVAPAATLTRKPAGLNAVSLSAYLKTVTFHFHTTEAAQDFNKEATDHVIAAALAEHKAQQSQDGIPQWIKDIDPDITPELFAEYMEWRKQGKPRQENEATEGAKP